MYAPHSSDTGLNYTPYVSDPNKYKDHFVSSSFYNPTSFCPLGGGVEPPALVGEGSGGGALVKLVSPTEGAVARAKEELKREKKEKRARNSPHLLAGKGRSSTQQRKQKSGAKRKKAKPGSKTGSKKSTKSKAKPKSSGAGRKTANSKAKAKRKPTKSKGAASKKASSATRKVARKN